MSHLPLLTFSLCHFLAQIFFLGYKCMKQDPHTDTSQKASLPVKCVGLGIQSAVQLAPSAFLASAAGSSGLVTQILPSHLQDIPLSAMAEALKAWSQGHQNPPSPPPVSHHQSEGSVHQPKPYSLRPQTPDLGPVSWLSAGRDLVSG